MCRSVQFLYSISLSDLDGNIFRVHNCSTFMSVLISGKFIIERYFVRVGNFKVMYDYLWYCISALLRWILRYNVRSCNPLNLHYSIIFLMLQLSPRRPFDEYFTVFEYLSRGASIIINFLWEIQVIWFSCIFQC